MAINNFDSPISSDNLNNGGSNYTVGKVFATTLNNNTPSQYVYDKFGLGSIVFIEYNTARTLDSYLGDIKNPSDSNIAIPLIPNQKYYPVVGELVLIFDLPSNITQINGVSTQKYYLSTINIWKNIHHNSQISPEIMLGKTFEENPNINQLQPYEGDYILEGRFGNSLRFGSTSKDVNVPNLWSKNGNNGEPITILNNGSNFDSSSLQPYIENINKDNSSIYLTSFQTIPISSSKKIENPLSIPTEPNKYSKSQIILNSDRVLINSKKDDVLIYGNTNVGVFAKNHINIDSDSSIIINSPKIYMGLNNGKLPSEPAVLGIKTVEWLMSLLELISEYTKLLSVARDSVNQPIQGTKVGFDYVNGRMETMVNDLKNIISSKNFVS